MPNTSKQVKSDAWSDNYSATSGDRAECQGPGTWILQVLYSLPIRGALAWHWIHVRGAAPRSNTSALALDGDTGTAAVCSSGYAELVRTLSAACHAHRDFTGAGLRTTLSLRERANEPSLPLGARLDRHTSTLGRGSGQVGRGHRTVVDQGALWRIEPVELRRVDRVGVGVDAGVR